MPISAKAKCEEKNNNSLYWYIMPIVCQFQASLPCKYYLTICKWGNWNADFHWFLLNFYSDFSHLPF